MHPRRSSATSRLIARCTLLAARDPERAALAPVEVIAPLTAMLVEDGGGAWFDFALDRAWARTLLGRVERTLLPGIVTHYLARKAWLELTVRAALVRGMSQIVVVGAGFDTLAWRLHLSAPGVQFFELDHPATQAPKCRALGGAANFTFLPCDLSTQSPAEVLRACPGFSVEQPALFIAEGLLMYFPEARVAELLREFAALNRAPVEVLFTFMARAPDGSIGFRGEHAAIGWWLRQRREPFQWGIAPEQLPNFLQPVGLQLLARLDHDDLRAQIMAPRGLAHLPLARGECLCHCVAHRP